MKKFEKKYIKTSIHKQAKYKNLGRETESLKRKEEPVINLSLAARQLK